MSISVTTISKKNKNRLRDKNPNKKPVRKGRSGAIRKSIAEFERTFRRSATEGWYPIKYLKERQVQLEIQSTVFHQIRSPQRCQLHHHQCQPSHGPALPS